VWSAIFRDKLVQTIYSFYGVVSYLHRNCTANRKGDSDIYRPIIEDVYHDALLIFCKKGDA